MHFRVLFSQWYIANMLLKKYLYHILSFNIEFIKLREKLHTVLLGALLLVFFAFAFFKIFKCLCHIHSVFADGAPGRLAAFLGGQFSHSWQPTHISRLPLESFSALADTFLLFLWHLSPFIISARTWLLCVPVLMAIRLLHSAINAAI